MLTCTPAAELHCPQSGIKVQRHQTPWDCMIGLPATGQSVRSFAKPAPVQRHEIKYVCNRLMAQRLGVPLVEQGLKQQQELKRRGICVDWTGR